MEGSLNKKLYEVTEKDWDNHIDSIKRELTSIREEATSANQKERIMIVRFPSGYRDDELDQNFSRMVDRLKGYTIVPIFDKQAERIECEILYNPNITR